MDGASPLSPFIDRDGVVILDGGLATELQRRGHDLDHELWSARLLADAPEAIGQLHDAYLEAGADCVIAASYQASFPGLRAAGMRHADARRLLELSVAIACEARDAFVKRERSGGRYPMRPLVAASIGPYGAYLADGSEYTGRYGISRTELLSFHEERWKLLAATDADLLAIETLPSIDEARVLRTLLDRTPERPAWVSFSCRDGSTINDGTDIVEAVELFSNCASVLAIGVNCTDPADVESLITKIHEAAPTKAVVAYPNSGEVYDGATHRWIGVSNPSDFGNLARKWKAAGASLIGGCCRTGPAHVTAIRKALSDPRDPG